MCKCGHTEDEHYLLTRDCAKCNCYVFGLLENRELPEENAHTDAEKKDEPHEI